jgi:hypothetical protein
MAQSEVVGLGALKSGFLYIIIAGLIEIIGIVMFIPAATFSFFSICSSNGYHGCC